MRHQLLALIALALSNHGIGAPVAPGHFDLSVNNAPAAQVFMQIGSGTSYNMLIAPEVVGNISVTLKDTTVLEAMESLRDLFGYDFRVTGNRILVLPNTVQTKIFKINYLPGRRQGASDIRVTSSSISQAPAVGSNGGLGNANTYTNGNGNSNANGYGTGTGSTNQAYGQRADDSAHVRTTSDADFWREVQASLNSLVGSADRRSVVLNPSAGVIVVRATPAELRQVGDYLAAVQVSISRQVMLEAKIIEVELNADTQTGVNWAAFSNRGNSKLSIGVVAPGAMLGSTGSLTDGINSAVAGASLAASTIGNGFFGLAFQSANFAAMLNFLETQGKVSVLSSPRIATLNNQKAVLKVGSDELYLTGISTTTTTGAANSTTTPSLNLQPFFSGIALDVTPQVDDEGNVMLHVHPSISRVTEKQKNINLGSLGSFKLPLAASTVNETDSIVRLRDGQIVAIGGLMLQDHRDDRSGLPGLSEAPVIGALFRQTGAITLKREMVVLIKASVIRDGEPWPEPKATPGALTAPSGN